MNKSLKKLFCFFCVTFIILFQVTKADTTQEQQILDAKNSTNGNKMRFVFILSAPTTYHIFGLENPNRLVIDIDNARLTANLQSLNLKNTVVNDIREATHDDNGVRIVLDLNQPVQESYFIIPGNLLEKTRLVVDITNLATGNAINSPAKIIANNTPSATTTTQKNSVNSTKPNNNLSVNNTNNNLASKSINNSNNKVSTKNNTPFNQVAQNPANNPTSLGSITSFAGTNGNNNTTPTPVSRSRNVIVVIDPGHGGKDPGATGPRGIHEKNVVLAIAKKIQADINQMQGMQADLTRNGDYFITLRGRLAIARQDKADMFVAIHADSFYDKTAVGASVFALSENGATSESARWLADNENSSELGGVQDFNDKSYLVRSVLLDLSQTVTITQSLQIGQQLIQSIGNVTPLHHNSVQQAAFVVLKSPDIPSLLIETGFITNPYEENELSNPAFQSEIAQSIATGIINYFKQNPPPGTLFALEQKTKTYIVQKNDTLLSIAQEYGVTSGDLKILNDLSSNQVHPGEAIKIPINLSTS